MLRVRDGHISNVGEVDHPSLPRKDSVTKASVVLRQYFERINDVELFLVLFAGDGVFEFPHLRTVGLPTWCEGKDAIRSLLQKVQGNVSLFTFKNVVIYELVDPYQVFGEYDSEAVIKATGRLYFQKYSRRMVVDEHGKIKLMREFLEIIANARVMFPTGPSDIPSADEVSS